MVTHRETARHIAAFENWYEADRDCKSVMESCSVSERSVYLWMDWFGWRAKADRRDAEIERRAAKDAVKRKADMIERHRKAGELLVGRGRERMAKHPIGSDAAAIAAIKAGIDIERTAEGLPAWIFDLLGAGDAEIAAIIRSAAGSLAAGGGPDAGEAAGYTADSGQCAHAAGDGP